MKNLYNIFLVSACVLIGSNLQAQYQSIFGANQTSWKYSFYSCLGCSEIDSCVVVYGRDSLIQGKSFRRIKPTNALHFLSDFYLSEDLVTGEIFYIDSAYTNNQMIKISSLSMNVGDTLKALGAIVDSVYVENSLKKIRTNFVINNYTFTMIEGVGTNFGVNYRAMGLSDGLLCQIKDSLANYTGTHATLNCNSNSTSLSDVRLKNQIIIQPNPASTFVEINLNGLVVDEIELLEVKGSLIKTFRDKENRIDVSEIESGFYFLKIYSNIGIVTKKLIIAK